MASVLVGGTGDRAEQLADRLRSAGHDVAMCSAGAKIPPESVDFYLQLPVAVTLSGNTLVGRVRSFLAGGLLTRFELVEELLPSFRGGARIALISGNTAAGAVLPDDSNARLALLHVLAHALQAELVDRQVRVQVVGGDRSDDVIVHSLLRGSEDLDTQFPEAAFPLSSKRQYEDWRAEVMGMRSAITG